MENCTPFNVTNCKSSVYGKVRWTVVKKCESVYYKLPPVLQNAMVLLQIATSFTKCDDYYKFRRLHWFCKFHLFSILIKRRYRLPLRDLQKQFSSSKDKSRKIGWQAAKLNSGLAYLKREFIVRQNNRTFRWRSESCESTDAPKWRGFSYRFSRDSYKCHSFRCRGKLVIPICILANAIE